MGDERVRIRRAIALVVAACALFVTPAQVAEAQALTFEDLSDALKRQFHDRGTHGAGRTDAQARRIYESIPSQVRAGGEESVRTFLNGRDWSHIRPRSKGGHNGVSNGVWEDFAKNRARGARQMSPSELAAARAALEQQARVAVLEAMGKGLLSGAAIGAVTGLVVCSVEFGLDYVHGTITGAALAEGLFWCGIAASSVGAAINGVLVALATAVPALSPAVAAVAIPFAVVTGVALSRQLWMVVKDGAIPLTKNIIADLTETTHTAWEAVRAWGVSFFPPDIRSQEDAYGASSWLLGAAKDDLKAFASSLDGKARSTVWNAVSTLWSEDPEDPRLDGLLRLAIVCDM